VGWILQRAAGYLLDGSFQSRRTSRNTQYESENRTIDFVQRVRTSRPVQELLFVAVDSPKQTVFEKKPNGMHEIAPLIVAGDIEYQTGGLQTAVTGNQIHDGFCDFSKRSLPFALLERGQSQTQQCIAAS
jgi:hypothetical protein